MARGAGHRFKLQIKLGLGYAGLSVLLSRLKKAYFDLIIASALDNRQMLYPQDHE